jgi:hypothetical protein
MPQCIVGSVGTCGCAVVLYCLVERSKSKNCEIKLAIIILEMCVLEVTSVKLRPTEDLNYCVAYFFHL